MSFLPLFSFQCSCRHRLSADEKIGEQDQGSCDQPGCRINIEQEAEIAMSGKQGQYPEDPEHAGPENSDHGRRHGVTHAPHGGPGDFIAGYHPLESQDVGKADDGIFEDFGICCEK